MDQPILPFPQVPPDERVRLRARLVIEEAIEFVEACFGIDPKKMSDGATERQWDLEIELDNIKGRLGVILEDLPVRLNLVAAADALADIAYVVEGSNLAFGIDGDAVLEEVHRTNMLKATGEVRADGKRLKPEGWTPPDVAGVLEKQKQNARRFPVLTCHADRARRPEWPQSVPWSFLAPHEEHAKRNHDQSLERLADRGGLDLSEMAAIVEERKWRKMTDAEIDAFLTTISLT